ncbi:DUF6586 family protein [Allohahella marinimesophila]|uniref:Uncharacterized protein n=1 Tax=Allohahella marinimesophila TaxID=1054972 RepID=A0ABP7QAF9_9GAMM
MAAPTLTEWQSFISANIFGAEQMQLQQQKVDSRALQDIHERAALLFLQMAWTGLLQSLARQQGLQLERPSLDALEQEIGHGTAETGVLRNLLAERDSWLTLMLEAIAEVSSAHAGQGASRENGVSSDEEGGDGLIAMVDLGASSRDLARWSGSLRALVYQLESSSLEC